MKIQNILQRFSCISFLFKPPCYYSLLGFLSTAEWQQFLLFSYRMGKYTVSNTIFKKCNAMNNVLWKACL